MASTDPRPAAVTDTAGSASTDLYILVPVAVASFALALFGLHRCGSPSCSTQTTGEMLTRAFDLVRGQGAYALGRDPWELVLAQYLLPGIAIFAGAKLFLRGLRRDLKSTLVRRARDHTIICGLGDTGRSIARRLSASGERVVVVDPAADAGAIAECDALGIPLIRGEGDSRALRLAGVARARRVIVTTGDDTTNLDVCLRIRDERNDREGRSRIVVAPEVRAYSLAHRLAVHSRGVLGTERVEVRLFNTHASAGRALSRLGLFKHDPRLHCAAPTLVIVGLGDTGVEVLRQIVQTIYAAPGQRVNVFVIDRSEEAEARIDAQLPALRELADFTFLTIEVTETTSSAQLAPALGRSVAAVIVCLSDDQVSLSAALVIRDCLDREGQIGTPVAVRTARRPKLGSFASAVEANALLPDRLVPFGDVDFLTAPVVDADDELDALARAAHAIYRGESAPIPDWSRLPEGYKESNRSYVDRLPFSLEAIGIRVIHKQVPALLTLEEPEVEALAEAEHWRWCIERRLNGWTSGRERDEFRKKHPSLVPWTELDETIRAENRRRAAQVPELFRAAGYELCRQEVVLWNGQRSALDRRLCIHPKPGHRVILAEATNAELRARLPQCERSFGCSVIVALSPASMRELSRGRVSPELAQVVRSPAVDQVLTAHEVVAMGDKPFCT